MIETIFYFFIGLLVVMMIGMVVVTILTGFPYNLLKVKPPKPPTFNPRDFDDT